MKYYIIAGEASGDLHGGNLIKALHQEDPTANIRGWGGDMMQKQGMKLVKHYRDLAFMGFVEVVVNLRTILRNISFCKKDILAFQPDALILIDYPGFNLRIAKWARQQGIRVLYYISPQIWAWNAKRVHGIKKSVNKMYVILPFEKAFYDQYDYSVEFVGHPLLDVIDRYDPPAGFHREYKLDPDRPLVALLPGSRRQEISRMLQGMLAAARERPRYQFVLAAAPSIPDDFYRNILNKEGVSIPLVSGRTYDILSLADAALVTSGTATLETALFEVPEVVCYQGSPLSYQIARRVIRVKYISLVNLVVDRELVTELIQSDFRPKRILTELDQLFEPERRAVLQTGYRELKAKLGHSGASQKAAKHMVQFLNDV
jgi:lipid-A-disaccharide synthase